MEDFSKLSNEELELEIQKEEQAERRRRRVNEDYRRSLPLEERSSEDIADEIEGIENAQAFNAGELSEADYIAREQDRDSRWHAYQIAQMDAADRALVRRHWRARNAQTRKTPMLMPDGFEVDSAQFNTRLTPDEEDRFQEWKKKYAPRDSGAVYDLRGAFKEGLRPDPKNGHWPDKFKKPNHPTFSTESQYARGEWRKYAGGWKDGEFVSSPYVRNNRVDDARRIELERDLEKRAVKGGWSDFADSIRFEDEETQRAAIDEFLDRHPQEIRKGKDKKQETESRINWIRQENEAIDTDEQSALEAGLAGRKYADRERKKLKFVANNGKFYEESDPSRYLDLEKGGYFNVARPDGKFDAYTLDDLLEDGTIILSPVTGDGGVKNDGAQTRTGNKNTLTLPQDAFDALREQGKIKTRRDVYGQSAVELQAEGRGGFNGDTPSRARAAFLRTAPFAGGYLADESLREMQALTKLHEADFKNVEEAEELLRKSGWRPEQELFSTDINEYKRVLSGLAEEEIARRTENREWAQKEVQYSHKTAEDKILGGLLDSSGYLFEYMIPGAAIGKLGKGATLAQRALRGAKAGIAPAVRSGMSRYEKLNTADYATSGDGTLEKVYGAEDGVLKAVAGSGVETAVEIGTDAAMEALFGVAGKGLSAAGRGLAKTPLAGGLARGIARVANGGKDAARRYAQKFMSTRIGQMAAKTATVLDELRQATGVSSNGLTEGVEEVVQQFADEVVGLDKKSAEYKGLSKEWQDFANSTLSRKGLSDIWMGLIGQMAVQGAIGAGAAVASYASKDAQIARRDLRGALKAEGINDATINSLTPKQQHYLLRAFRHFSENPDKLEKVLAKGGWQLAEVGRNLVRQKGFHFTASLEERGVAPESFNATFKTDAAGNVTDEWDFQAGGDGRQTIRDDVHGVSVERNADGSVTVVNELRGDRHTVVDGNMDAVREAADAEVRQNQALALDNEEKFAYLEGLRDKMFKGRSIHVFDTEQALKNAMSAGLRNNGEFLGFRKMDTVFGADGHLGRAGRTGRAPGGFYVPDTGDGTSAIVLVLDNIESPADMARVLRHEAGHGQSVKSERALDVDFLSDTEKDSDFMRFRKSKQADLVARGMSPAAAAAVLNSKEGWQETFANWVQSRAHKPTRSQRREHEKREERRRRGEKLAKNDADWEVWIAEAEANNNDKFVEGVLEKVDFIPVDAEAQAGENSTERTNDETRNGADETQPQSDEGGVAGRPAQAEAPQPVEGAEARAEAPDARVVEPQMAESRAEATQETTGARGETQTGEGTPAAQNAPEGEKPHPADTPKKTEATAPAAKEQGNIPDIGEARAATEDFAEETPEQNEPDETAGEWNISTLANKAAKEQTVPAAKEKTDRPAEYLAWLEKYKAKDTDRRFAEWQKKQRGKRAKAEKAKKSTQKPAASGAPASRTVRDNLVNKRLRPILDVARNADGTFNPDALRNHGGNGGLPLKDLRLLDEHPEIIGDLGLPKKAADALRSAIKQAYNTQRVATPNSKDGKVTEAGRFNYSVRAANALAELKRTPNDAKALANAQFNVQKALEAARKHGAESGDRRNERYFEKELAKIDERVAGLDGAGAQKFVQAVRKLEAQPSLENRKESGGAALAVAEGRRAAPGGGVIRGVRAFAGYSTEVKGVDGDKVELALYDRNDNFIRSETVSLDELRRRGETIREYGDLAEKIQKRGADAEGLSISFDTPELSPEGRRQYDDVVRRYTNADGTKKRGWMRAPNGQPTKLTERQWVQVRTPAFKEWFGDWERNANIEKLKNAKDIEFKWGNQFSLDGKSARRWLLGNIRGEYENLDTGDTIHVVRDGVRKVTSHSLHSEAHLKSTAAIPQIIRDSVFITELDAEKENANYDKYRYYVAGIEIDGVPYTVKMVVGLKGRDQYYDHDLTQIRKGNLLEALSRVSDPEDPTSSLDAPYDTKLRAILQPSGHSRVVDENGEPLVVYHGTKDDFTVFTDRQGKRYDAGYLGRGFYFTDREESERNYAEWKRGFGAPHTMAAFLSIKNPLVLAGKGPNLSVVQNALGMGEPEDTMSVTTMQAENIRSETEKRGHDGIIRRLHDGETIYVAFEPKQIKSATDNNGDFDDANNDINFDTPELAVASGRQKQAGIAYPDASNEIRVLFDTPVFGKKNREEFGRILAKHRPNLDANAVIDEIAKFDTPKKRKVALHWVVRGAIRLPEDAYKVEDALSVAEKAKADPFAYKSPLELIEAHKDIKPTRKAINPETVPELSNRRDEGDGIVSYEVSDTREGQAAMRRIIDTHWGEDANPWCLLARNNPGDRGFGNWTDRIINGERYAEFGLPVMRENSTPEEWRAWNEKALKVYRSTLRPNLDEAWTYWQRYSALPKRVAFKNGRLLAFMATERLDLDNWHDYQRFQDRLEGRYPERVREYKSWTETEEAIENGVPEFLEWMKVNYGDEFNRAWETSGAAEEWWDRQDESHPDLDWARGNAQVNFDTPNIFTGSAADYANRSRQGGVDDGPSVKHIGTGEGSQVYGWGLYGSTVRGVAEKYAMPSGLEIRRHGNVVKPWNDKIAGLIRNNFSSRNPIESALKDAKENGWDQKDIESLENGDYEVVASHSNLYEQTFFTNRAPGDESHLLKWYEPVNEKQLGWVRNAAEKEGVLDDQFKKFLDVAEKRINGEGGDKANGESLYLHAKWALGSPQAASEFLYRAGIDGVKYPVDSYGKTVKDGDKAGWNYVAFSDEHIRVDHKWTNGVLQFDTPELDVNFDMNELKSRLDDALNIDPAKGRVLPRSSVVEFSDTPPALLSIGMPMAKIISRADTIRKIGREHRLSSSDMARLPMEYARPVLVFRDGNSFVVVTGMQGMTEAGVLKPVEVFLRPAGESEGRNNYIASAYAREPSKEQEYLRLAKTPGALLMADKKRAADIGLEEATYSQLRPLIDSGPLTRTIIPQPADGRNGVSPAEDAAYMDAVRRGDMETAEHMEQEAVSRAMPSTKVVDGNGRPLKVYHGSRTGANIKIFNTPSFFSSDRDTADMFKKEADFILRVNGKEVAIDDVTARQIADELTQGDYTPDEMADWSSFEELIGDIEDNGKGYGGRDVVSDALAGVGINTPLNEIMEMSFKRVPDIYECYLNITNPLEIDFKGKTWGQDGTREMEAAVRGAAKNGYDGVIVRNIREGGFLGELRNGEEPPLSTDYIPISPNQIKSADAVTYDDAGNVIPLSQRFNPQREDVRFDTPEFNIPGFRGARVSGDARARDAAQSALTRTAPADSPDRYFGAKASYAAHGTQTYTARELGIATTDKATLAAAHDLARDTSNMRELLDAAIYGRQRDYSPVDIVALTVQFRDLQGDMEDILRRMETSSHPDSLQTEKEMIERIMEDNAKASSIIGSKTGQILRAFRIGISADVRDSEAYILQSMRANRQRKGQGTELSDEDKSVAKRMAEQLKAENETLKALTSELEEANRLLIQKRAEECVERARRRAKSRTLTAARRAEIQKDVGIDIDDETAELIAGLERSFNADIAFSNGDIIPPVQRENKSVLRNDDEARFAGLVSKIGFDAAEKFVEMKLPKAQSAWAEFRKRHEKNGATELARLAASIAGKRHNTAGGGAGVREKRMFADGTTNPREQRVALGRYLRRYMNALVNDNPDMPMQEIQEKMAAAATALTGAKHDAEAMLAALGGVDGYDLETRGEIQRKIAKARHATQLFRQGKKSEAARESGLLYEGEATVLAQMEEALRRMIAEKANEIDALSSFSEKNAEAVERVKRLRAELKEAEDTLVLMRKQVSLAERKEKFAAVLEKRLAEAQQAANALRGEVESDGFKERKARIETKIAELKAVLAVARRDEISLKRIQDKIAEYEKRIADGDYDQALQTYRANDAELRAKLALARERRNKLRHKLDEERRNRNYRNMGVVGKTLYGLGGILGEMKGVVASFDLSSVLRQGGQLTWAHPFIAAKNLEETLKAWKSGDYADNLMAQLKMRPNWKYYEQAGIDFTDWGENATSKEDAFLLNQYRKITNIKLLKKGVMASERAFAMFLNLMRADVFDAMVNGSTFGSAANMNDSQLKALGRFINIASQRGSFEKGGKVANAIPFLNFILWSPRNVASRFQFLWETAKLAGGGAAYGDKTLRSLFAKELVRYIGGLSAATMFLKAVAELFRDDDDPPNETEFDPRSSDFLKVRFGNVRMDLTSGLTPIIVFGARMISGKTKNSRGQIRESNRLELMGRFARQKFAPAASLVYDMLVAREDFERRDIVYTSLWEKDNEHISALRYFVSSFVPLSGADLLEQAEIGGLPKTFVTGVMSLLGANVQAFDPYNYKQLKGDYVYFRRLYNETHDPEEKQNILRRCPMLKRRPSIEAALKRVRELEDIKKKNGENGYETPDIDDRIKKAKEAAIGVMAGID